MMTNENFMNVLSNAHANAPALPPSSAVCAFAHTILGILFPEFAQDKYNDLASISFQIENQKKALFEILSTIDCLNYHLDPLEATTAFFDNLPNIYEDLKTDLQSILGGDPAAQNESEIIRAYPGFYAIAFYRLAHQLHLLSVPVIPRIITSFAHNHTGIDIHPGAHIGQYFCIDHGTGVVIGETTTIGKHVKLYQGVTLGALSVDKSMASQKRHPTIEDHVVIYAGATILGGETVVGNHSVIGGNVWLTRGVAPYSVVYHKPQIEVRQADQRSDIPY